MKKQTLNEVMVNSVCAQLYSRLTLAAAHGLYVYWADISPILFGMQFDKVDDEQSETLWALLELTIQMDADAGRPPLAALFVSRKGGKRKPRPTFFAAYKTYYGKKIDDADWEQLVESVWKSYHIPQNALERLT